MPKLFSSHPVPAQTTRTTIRARAGFAVVEEIAWQAERNAPRDYRLFYKRLARTARSFQVQLNLADVAADVVLPDATPEDCPSNLWHEIDRAARELELRIPCPAVTVAAMALQGDLDSGRIEFSQGRRSLVAVPKLKLTAEERQWIETYERAIEEEPMPSHGSAVSLQEIPAQPAAVSDADLGDFAAVLRCLRNGKFRCVKVTYQIIEGSGLKGGRVTVILAHLQRAGRIRRLNGNRWVMTAD
jgi:hypothetical protein